MISFHFNPIRFNRLCIVVVVAYATVIQDQMAWVSTESVNGITWRFILHHIFFYMFILFLFFCCRVSLHYYNLNVVCCVLCYVLDRFRYFNSLNAIVLCVSDCYSMCRVIVKLIAIWNGHFRIEIPLIDFVQHFFIHFFSELLVIYPLPVMNYWPFIHTQWWKKDVLLFSVRIKIKLRIWFAN